jgi:pimeloyl-ACP methyl ester carboxylesterase
VACALAVKQPCSGLILQSTFTSLTDRAHESYPFLPVTWLSRYRFDNRSAVAQLECPKLIMHSPKDEVTGYHHGRELLEAAHQPCEWGELWGGHNNPAPLSLAKCLQKFLSQDL